MEYYAYQVFGEVASQEMKDLLAYEDEHEIFTGGANAYFRGVIHATGTFNREGSVEKFHDDATYYVAGYNAAVEFINNHKE